MLRDTSALVQSPGFADELLEAVRESYRYPADPIIRRDPDGPTHYDEAWESAFRLGADAEPAGPPAEYSDLLKAVWEIGYEAGERQRWTDYGDWAEQYETYLNFCRDMEETDRRAGRFIHEQERRGSLVGHPAFEV